MKRFVGNDCAPVVPRKTEKYLLHEITGVLGFSRAYCTSVVRGVHDRIMQSLSIV